MYIYRKGKERRKEKEERRRGGERRYMTVHDTGHNMLILDFILILSKYSLF
jgi:hypothetical protein